MKSIIVFLFAFSVFGNQNLPSPYNDVKEILPYLDHGWFANAEQLQGDCMINFLTNAFHRHFCQRLWNTKSSSPSHQKRVLLYEELYHAIESREA